VSHAFPSNFTAGLAVKHGYWTIEETSPGPSGPASTASPVVPGDPALSVSLPEDYEHLAGGGSAPSTC
jgi:hypothetical protein